MIILLSLATVKINCKMNNLQSFLTVLFHQKSSSNRRASQCKNTIRYTKKLDNYIKKIIRKIKVQCTIA